MKRPNYTIIRCWTTDKIKVMDTLCNADEYSLIRDHIDAVYYNGNSREEKNETRVLTKNSIDFLKRNGITADSSPEYVDDWLFIQLH